MTRTLAIAAVLGVAMLASGCMGRLVKEGMGAALGAKANIVEVQALNKSKPIGPVTIGTMDNAMGRPVTGDWLVALSAQLRQRTVADKDLAAGQRAVKLNGVVVHLEGSGLTDQAFGPAPEVIVRVTVVDTASGEVIGIANAVGRARGTTSSGQEDLTKAFAEGVTKWLRSSDRRAHERDRE